MEISVLMFCIIILAIVVGVMIAVGMGWLYWRTYPRAMQDFPKPAEPEPIGLL